MVFTGGLLYEVLFRLFTTLFFERHWTVEQLMMGNTIFLQVACPELGNWNRKVQSVFQCYAGVYKKTKKITPKYCIT